MIGDFGIDLHAEYSAVGAEGISYSFDTRPIASLVLAHAVPAMANHIELWPEDEATGSRDFGRGYAHAVKEVVAFLREVATP